MYAHNARTPIPQPPHTAGTSYRGLRAAIDPHQIPSPIEVIEADRDDWKGKPYMTLPGEHAPLSTTEFVAIDQGNSSPKFLRVSTWNVPHSSRLASECEIPIAAVIQPFADLDPREEPVPLVDTGNIGPARCEKCRGYINPWCTWTAGGGRWKCNLCDHETEVAAEYFCNLDSSLLRLDHLQRPELTKGTVDFAVPEAYWAQHPPPRITPLYQSVLPSEDTGFRTPEPMNYVFAIDVSVEAIQSGFTRAACTALLRVLYGDILDTNQKPCIPLQTKIAIVSYDRTLHFYNLSSRLTRAELLVVPDVDDVFVPLRDGLLVDPEESRSVVEGLLRGLADVHKDTVVYECALGAALLATLDCLAGKGGQVVAFASALPTIGIGALTPREDETALFDTDKESTLFIPRNDTWKEIGEQCADQGIGVNIFLGMSRPIDVATIGVVASLTGGELFFHPRFDPLKDTIVLNSQLRRLFTRTTVYTCAMRVRCSSGLRVTKQYGNFYENAAGDMQFGTMDADKSVTVVFEHSHNLDERRYAFIQSAALYTTITGERRVRVCNVALQVVTMAGNVFRYADMDTVVACMLRQAVSRLSSQKISYIQEELTEKCGSILLGYRKNCATATAPSQLVIPEAFRALPVYVLAMMKSKPLKARNVSSDVRNYYAHKIMAMSVRSIMHHLYPRLLALHDLDDTIALPDPKSGEIEMPSLMRDSYVFMSVDGVYLIDNEDISVLWIGQSVSPQVLKDLIGVEDVIDIHRNILALPRLESRLSTQVHNILTHRYQERGRTPKFCIARQNMDGAEIEFSDMLVEDQNNAAMSYLDYLCIVHKQISTALTTGASLSGTVNFRGSIW